MIAPNKRNVRGKTRGVILDKLIEANGGKPLPITIKPSDGKKIGKYYEKLSNEIGLTVRQHAPVRVEKWKQMPRAEINTMFDRIKFFPCLTMKEKFALDLTQEHVKKSLEKQLSDRFRNWRCDLHKHFKKFPTVVEAKRNPHKSVSNQEDWDYLCDRFSSEEFKVKFSMNNHSNLFLIEYSTNYIYIIFNNNYYYNVDQQTIQ
ncbi:hypothetical protein CK203_023696 [Vitis vinifera]|uniref:Uncharacterized protein n=1 Tax=Vitis vinifera TaxID=29760 RepID=A0A438JBT2_VITVI|nr:hypothetical protein CK203_023696 [Vitis vinifera]